MHCINLRFSSVATRQRLKASFNLGFPPSRLSHQKASFHGIRLGVGSSLRSLLPRFGYRKLVAYQKAASKREESQAAA